ncbi:HEXXH motif domain-containing protein [Actinomadura fulvescens]|uniref:HEXXH motif domain-containing protein n=1 Tax=Actinomadura fulvescens TaxID=46160 RepID=A0ABP6C1H7_9ACTN
MNLSEYIVPAPIFQDLAAGAGGPRAARFLAGMQYSKHVLLVKGVRDTATALGHPEARLARQAYELLTELQDRAPEAVDEVMKHPPVAAWSRRTIQAMTERAAGVTVAPGQLAGLAAAAASRAGIAATVELPVLDGTLMLPSIGRVTGLPAGSLARIRTAAARTSGAHGGRTRHGEIEVTAGDVILRLPAETDAVAPDAAGGPPGWQPLRTLTCTAGDVSLRVLIEDVDPHRMPGAGNVAPRLSSAEVARWQRTMDAAWDLLTRHHHDAAVEVAAIVRALTPLKSPEQGHTSATSRETFGCVALSAPLDACAVAVTLAHETQHGKLSALLDAMPLLLPEDGSRYYAPWRDDPRPLSGLLQGAYAHLSVARFWRRQRHHERADAAAMFAETEYVHWRDATALGIGTIVGSGRLTPAGQDFLAGMAGEMRSWQADDVRPEAEAAARQAAAEHRARWQHGSEGRRVEVEVEP